jgi:Na+/melibiose symporter-like transporter
MALYFVFAGLGMGIWMPIARRVGDKWTLRLAAGYVFVVLALLPIWADLEFEWSYLLFMAILGIGFGAGPFLLRSMIGVVAHEHERRTGQSVRGSAYAVTTFFDKLGSGAAAGLVLPLVGWLGFDAANGGGEVGRSALLWVGVSAPILGFGVVVAALFAIRDPADPDASD